MLRAVMSDLPPDANISLVMPDPTVELYYGLPFQAPQGQQHGHGGLATGAQADMRIRGRGLGEDKDEDVEDDSMSDGSVGGTSFCSDYLLPDAPDAEVDTDGNDGRVLNLRGGSGGSESGGKALVSSFSGYTPCNFHFARGFYAAVDTVLGLEERFSVQITVALIEFLPNEEAGILKLESGTLGNVDTEKDLHDRLLAAYTWAQQSTKSEVAFFVCRSSKEAALVELQKLQGKAKDAKRLVIPKYDPSVFKFERQNPNGSGFTGAYLWMPGAVDKNTPSNLYTEWFQTIVRITSGPHDLTAKLGRHNAQVPQASYMVQVGNINPSFHHESPLPRTIWEAIVEWGRVSGNNVGVPLSFTSLGKRAFAQVPGYYPPASTTPTALDKEAVFKLAWDSVPEKDRKSVARMVIRRPGGAGSATFTCKNGSVDRQHISYENAERQLRNWLEHKYFFNIVPEWDKYEFIVFGRNGEQSTFELPGGQGWPYVKSLFSWALEQLGWKFDDVHVGRWVFRLDQRIAGDQGPEDTLQRNRVAWDMEIGLGRQENKLWKGFREALSVRRFQLQPIDKLHDGFPTSADPLASDEKDPIWSRWGCNRPSVSEDTGEPVVKSTKTQNQTQIDAQTHDHHQHQNTNTHQGQPSPVHARAQAQDQGQNQDQDHGILHQGVPQLGAGVDIFQSGKYYREQSFATPLSVQVGDQKPRFPINAPPIEHIRRPQGPDGIESDSMPVVSTQIMTPTEQRTLQQAFFQMRSIALNRAQQCPHKDCTAFFPVGPGNMAAFHAHLDAKHIGTHCPFCDETLFKYWSATDRDKHFVDHHSEYFTAKGDLLRETLLAERTESKGNVHPREEQYSFCPRCGRNHQLLSSKADRVHHDNSCFPGNQSTVPTEQYCRRCGEPDHVLAGDGSRAQRQQHQCAAAAATDPAHPTPASNTFCSNCALGCHQLPISYARRHLLNCKPLASERDAWCPWCGVDLKSGPQSVRLKHLAACVLKPASGQNPVCTDSGIPFESPRDHKARLLRRGLSNLGMNKREARISVPATCPVKSCQTDLTAWNAQGLYRHFLSHPENAVAKGGGLKSCPFCACDFEMRGFHTSSEKHRHFDDHLNGRSRRVLADETIGSNPDRESAAVLDAISTLRYDEHDQSAEIDRLSAEVVQLNQTCKTMSAENSSFRDKERKLKGMCCDGAFYPYCTLLTLSPPPPPPSHPTRRKRNETASPCLPPGLRIKIPARFSGAQYRLTPGRETSKRANDPI